MRPGVLVAAIVAASVAVAQEQDYGAMLGEVLLLKKDPAVIAHLAMNSGAWLRLTSDWESYSRLTKRIHRLREEEAEWLQRGVSAYQQRSANSLFLIGGNPTMRSYAEAANAATEDPERCWERAEEYGARADELLGDAKDLLLRLLVEYRDAKKLAEQARRPQKTRAKR